MEEGESLSPLLSPALLHCIKECREKDQPLDLVVKQEEKAAGRFKRARGLKALASVKWDGCPGPKKVYMGAPVLNCNCN